MGMQLRMHPQLTKPSPQLGTFISSSPLCFFHQRLQQKRAFGLAKNDTKDLRSGRRDFGVVVASSSSNIGSWDNWKPEKGAKSPSLSDVIWPSAGAFAAMAVLAKMDQALASKGLSITIAPLGAVCAVLFATPSSPGARKYNMFMAQIGCAAIGVLAFSIFGPGWLARSAGLAAAIAFMIITGAVHPPGKKILISSLTIIPISEFSREMYVCICSCKLAVVIYRCSEDAPIEFLVCFVSWCYRMHSPLFDTRSGDVFEEQLQVLRLGECMWPGVSEAMFQWKVFKYGVLFFQQDRSKVSYPQSATIIVLLHRFIDSLYIITIILKVYSFV